MIAFKMPSRRWISIFAAAAILAALFWTLDPRSVWRTFAEADGSDLILAASLTLWFPVLCAARWSLIVRGLGAPMRFRDSFRIVMAAWPLGAVTPAKSGDLVKLLFLRNVLPYSHTTGVILAERIVDVVVLCLMAMAFGWMYQFYASMLVSGAVLLGAAGFFAAASSRMADWAPPKYRVFLGDVLAASMRMVRSPAAFGWILAVTALNWFLSMLQTWLCYRAFHEAVPLSFVMAALPVAIFVGLIPVTLSGMGTRDSAMILLFGVYASPEASLSAGILYSVFGYWLLSLLGIPFLRSAFEGSIRGVPKRELLREAYGGDEGK